MKRSVFSTFLILVSVLFVTVNCMACGNKGNAVTESPDKAKVDTFVPDQRFASMDSLADFIMEEFSAKTVDEFVNRYEQQAAAIKSYGLLNHKGVDANRLDEVVLRDLQVLADSLSGGSTFDMMMCGRIERAMSHYLTAKDYCGGYSENPLYQAEMRDWLALEDELGNFYVNLAYLANWGGSIVHVTSSGSLAYMAEVRQKDYSQLKKDGHFANSESLTIAEARADFIQELADAKSLDAVMDDEMYDAEGYRKTLKEMCGHADRVTVLLDAWLDSRAKLCAAQSIPDAHTAHLIAELGTRMMELIEG